LRFRSVDVRCGVRKHVVTEVKQGKQILYRCDVCGMFYREREWAEKCQAWCETHEGTCNVEYIQHAVDPGDVSQS